MSLPTAATAAAPEDHPFGPYLTLDRQHWAALAAARPDNLDAPTLDRLRGIGDPTDAAEVRQVYLPLTDLLSLARALQTAGLGVSVQGFRPRARYYGQDDWSVAVNPALRVAVGVAF